MSTIEELRAQAQSKYKVIPGFSCLEMKREGQEMLRQELAGLSESEIQAYWDKLHEELLAWQADAKREYGEPPTSEPAPTS
jgi:hypothetical protein